MRDLAVLMLLLLTATSGAGIALCREPRRQVVAMSLNGLVLTLLFMVLQAPDVALSELAVGAAALPLLFLAVIAGIRTDRRRAGQDVAPDARKRREARWS